MLKQDFSLLRATLEEYTTDRIALIEPGGNHGDRLIYMGMEKLLEDIGVSYDRISYNMKKNIIESDINALPTNVSRAIRKNINKTIGWGNRYVIDELLLDGYDAIVVHGGGNINDVWLDGLRLINNLLRNYKSTDIIVAPQTYWFTHLDFKTFFSNNGAATQLFCREDYSNALLKNHKIDDTEEVLNAPDTALYLEKEDLRHHILNSNRNFTELVAFREDRESIASPELVKNISSTCPNPLVLDISKQSNCSFTEFVSLANQATTIHTDRLHVSILGTILGTTVEMYENTYYKNRGVYKRSLSKFEKTSFNDNYSSS